MKFYSDTKPHYLETDASGVGLVAALLQLYNIAPDNIIFGQWHLLAKV